MPSVGVGLSAASTAKGFMDSSKAEKRADRSAGSQAALAGQMSELAGAMFEEWENVWRPLERQQAEAAGRLLPQYEAATARGLSDANRNARRYEDIYLPIEDSVAADIGRDPQSRMDDASGRAIAAVDQQFDIASADLARSNFTRGLAPDDTMGGQRQMRLAQAGSRAREGNFAAENERSRALSERIGFLQQAPGRQPYVPGVPRTTSMQSPSGAMAGLQAAGGAQGGITDYYSGKARTAGEGVGAGMEYLSTKSDDISKFFGFS